MSLWALTNLNLSELYKLKSVTSNNLFVEHTYNNLTIIENNPIVDNVPSELSVINEEESVNKKPKPSKDLVIDKMETVLHQQNDTIPLTE